MTNNISIDGHKIKVAVLNSGMTREKIVVLVQESVRGHGLSFSLAGLMKVFEGELPRKDGKIVFDALIEVLGLASEFADSEAKTA